MEAAILAAETRVAEMEGHLNDHDFYLTRAKEIPLVMTDLEVAKKEVARLYARWEELTKLAAAAEASS
jgi:hypothetical protein